MRYRELRSSSTSNTPLLMFIVPMPCRQHHPQGRLPNARSIVSHKRLFSSMKILAPGLRTGDAARHDVSKLVHDRNGLLRVVRDLRSACREAFDLPAITTSRRAAEPRNRGSRFRN